MNLDIENVMEKNDPDELEYLKIGTRKYDEAEKANAEVVGGCCSHKLIRIFA